MNKKKVLYMALFLMFAVNVTLIVIFFSKGPRHSKLKEPKEIIINKLFFDSEQTIAYQLLIKEHRLSIRGFQDSIHKSKQNLYALLRGRDVSKADSIENQIGNYQIAIERTHFNHFSDLKKICKPDQLEAFNELTFELESLFSNRTGPPKKN